GDVAGDLVRGRRLLLHRPRDRVLDVVDLLDDRSDLADRLDRAAGVGLDRLDLPADVLRRARRLARQLLDLVRDAAGPLAGLAGARRLDRGVEGEEVRLLRDRGDDLDALADLAAAVAELLHGRVRPLGHADRRGADARRVGGAPRDLLDAGAHLLHADR